MRLNAQLRRGYFSLVGVMIIGLSALSTPEFEAFQKQALQEHAMFLGHSGKACKANSAARWQLASTPMDIRPLLLRKAMICQA